MVIIEEDMTASDVVLLASRLNGSISIGLPTLLTGPPFPTQLGAPVPASVSLDLSGCIGCVTLTHSAAHVYLAHMHLTGLERPAAEYLSYGLEYNLTFPLWAFQFNRSAGSSPRVTLRNVSLTLPPEEFQLLLAGLSPGAGLGDNLKFKVGGLLGIGFGSGARRVVICNSPPGSTSQIHPDPPPRPTTRPHTRIYIPEHASASRSKESMCYDPLATNL